jgi:putative membrane protein
MMWGYYPGMGWWMVVSSIFWLALVGIAVWALVRLVGHQTRTGSRSQQDELSSGSSAEEILRRRYARGEIDEATFERMREQLATSRSREPALPPPGKP